MMEIHPPPGFLGPLKIRKMYVEKNNVLSKAPPVPNHTHTHTHTSRSLFSCLAEAEPLALITTLVGKRV